jgi:hypothetical protein
MMTMIRIRPALLAALLAAGCATPGLDRAAAPPHVFEHTATLAAALNTTPPAPEAAPVNLAAALGLRGASGSAAAGRPSSDAMFDGGSRIGAAPTDPDALATLLDTVGAAEPAPAAQTEPAPQVRAATLATANGAASTRLWPEAAPAIEEMVRVSEEPAPAASVQLATIDATMQPMQPILPAAPISPPLEPTALLPAAAPAAPPAELTPWPVFAFAPEPTPVASEEPEVFEEPTPLAVEEPAPEPAPVMLASAAPAQPDPAPAVVETPAPTAEVPRPRSGMLTLEQLTAPCAYEAPKRRGQVTEVTCR